MPARKRRLILDLAPTTALLALGATLMSTSYESAGYQGPRAANFALLLAVVLPLPLRRRFPAPVLAAVFVAQGIWVALYYHGSHQPPFEPFAAGLVACFALGFHAEEAELRAGIAIFGLTVVATAVDLAAGGSTVGNGLPALVWWAGAIALGRILRSRQALVELLRERSDRLERSREHEIAEAAADERARIARELHDVIAHSVSLIVVQAGAERRLLSAAEQRTAQTLETIESSGREALTELRRLLGVLRMPSEDRLAPQPGLSRLPDLLEESAKAGQQVSLEISGDAVELAQGLDLTAYRIVQEGLTNARKHAPGNPVGVALRWRDRVLEIEIENTQPEVVAEANGAGHGLIGMRERVAMYGGSLESGPVQGERFRVRARLPVEGRVGA
jgi:signal transduction histidine kinase